MRLIISHKTRYCYDHAPRHLIQLLRLTPRTEAHQRVIEWRISTPGKQTRFEDAFGNVSHSHVLASPKQELELIVQGTVEVNALQGGALALDGGLRAVPTIAYLVPTPLTQGFEAVDQLARKALPDGLKTEWDALALARAVSDALPYTAGNTDVTSTARQAFEMASGVCQDHAHVMIAACRSLGVSARYVSGYVDPGNSRSAASHAWVDIWLADRWVSIDVTNGVFAGEYHCRLAIGLDYLDACPVRGMREGGHSEQLDVLVTVQTQQH